VDETIIPGHRPIFLDTSSVTRPKTEKPLFATLKKLLEDSTMLANKRARPPTAQYLTWVISFIGGPLSGGQGDE
jgi:hypothetical protein